MRKERKASLFRREGFSLLEVVVAVGIFGIVMVGILSLGVNLQRQNRALQQKLESIQLEQAITRLLADNNSCDCMFQNLGLPASGEVSMSSLKAGCGTALITQNQPVSPTGSGLKVSRIKLANLTSLSSGNRSADLVVDFQNDSLVTPLKPITIQSQTFVVSATNQVQQCLGMPGAQQMCTSMGGTWVSGVCQMDPSLTCASVGGTWSNGTCKMDPAPQCAAMGGTWNSSTSSCTMPTNVVKPTDSTTCAATYGSGWAWNGSACMPPEAGASCSIPVVKAGVISLDPQASQANCESKGGTWNPSATYGNRCTKKIAHGVSQGTPGGTCSTDQCMKACRTYECQNGVMTCTNEPITWDTSSGTCFVAGTKVLTSDGSWQRIESLGVGDQVVGLDGRLNKVTALWRPRLGDRKLYFLNGEIMTTGDHLFMSSSGDWAAIEPALHHSRRYNRLVEAIGSGGSPIAILLSAVDPARVGSIRVGGSLASIFGLKSVRSLERVAAPSQLELYTLMTDGNASFVVQGGYFADGIPQK